MSGKVVVNRCMSLDGYIAGPGHSMDWGGRALADLVAPDDLAEVAAATGAMLVGRRAWEVGDRMKAEEPDSRDYPLSGPMFLLTHRPLERSAGSLVPGCDRCPIGSVTLLVRRRISRSPRGAPRRS